MATYTPTIFLHQWEPEDPFLRQDFNRDFQQIDTAVRQLQTSPSGVGGTYVGNGETVTVKVGFRPSFLYIRSTYKSSADSMDTIFALGGDGCMSEVVRLSINQVYTYCTFTQTGFTISDRRSGGLNVSGATYSFFAFY